MWTGPTAAPASASRATQSAALRLAKIAASSVGERRLSFGRGRQPLGEVGTFERLAERGPGAGLGGGDVTSLPSAAR